jgi:molybdopterin adenylyltransferase
VLRERASGKFGRIWGEQQWESSAQLRRLRYDMGMPGIDESKPFVALRLAILTVSDTRTPTDDRSGDLLASLATGAGHLVVARQICPDDHVRLVATFRSWLSQADVDVIISTGGTGVTGRDVTPEALEAVSEKLIPGFGELFRFLSLESIGTSTIQSRATAGVAQGKYLFALPGSPGACRDAWEKILRFQLDVRHRPCNFAELIPRLTEGRA